MKKKLKKCCREAVEKLLERIKLERLTGPILEKTYSYDFLEGYNQAIADLETLKSQLKDEK